MDPDDIERQIMMEMEKEVQRHSQQEPQQPVPPPFEITPIPQFDYHADPSEDDMIQSAIEERLRKKKADRDRSSLSLSEGNSPDFTPNRVASPEDGATAHANSGPPAAYTFGTGAPTQSNDFFQSTHAQEMERVRREAEEQARQEAEEQVRREAEEEARREAEEEARREAEEEARREAEEEARQEAEEQARREAEEEARREAEEEARRETEEEARQEAEEQARREAEEEARREAEEEARREAEEQARREAEEQARREAEAQARREAEEQARQAAAEQARREAEEQARREAEAQARREAEAQARKEAEEQARQAAAEQARREAEEQARREAEAQARREAEAQARREAEEQTRQAAAEQARREAEEQARREAEAQARREAEAQARREAEEQARREAEEQARREAEVQARKEAEEQARQAAAEQARREAEAQARREAEEQARREAEEQARREAEAQARREAEAQARREAEEQARREAEEQARQAAAEQARREAEEQARREAEAQARREAEEQARREAEAQARREAEAQARKEAEEQARREEYERSLEEIRRKAREAVFREYSAKGKISGSGLTSPSNAPLSSSARVSQPASSDPSSPRPVTSDVPQATAAPVAAATAAAAPVPRTAPAVAPKPTVAQVVRPVTPVEAEPMPRLDSAASPDSPPDSRPLSTTSSRSGEEATVEDQEADETFDERMLPSQRDFADVESTSPVSDELETSASSRFSLSAIELMQNDNGILSGQQALSVSSNVSYSDKPLESFERNFAAELQTRGVTEDEVRHARLDIHRFDTIREPGKCLFPPNEEDQTIPAHAKVQLGFFSAKQTIITMQHSHRRSIAKRERQCTGRERPLSELTCYFENEIMQDTTLTVDDEDRPYNAPKEQLLSKEMIVRNDLECMEAAGSAISYGDPIQVWDKASGAVKDSKDAKAKQAHENRTSNWVWVDGLETKKPIPAMRTFTGGSVICVEASKILSRVTEIHGEATDPIIVSVALFSVTGEGSHKVSETFYFDAGLDVFYPQKERSDKARDNRVIVFIPKEYRSSLHLIAHVMRPCMEDYENYVDLYIRTDKYKPVHVTPMKQETLLLTQVSDVFEELGWCSGPVQFNKDMRASVTAEKLYRKPMTDSEIIRLIPDERSRNAYKTVPFKLEFRFSDKTNNEAAFPSAHADPLPHENETLVSLLDPNVMGARAETFRYAPCCIPILNSGYFTTYNNVYYFRVSKFKLMNVGSLRNFPSTHHTYAVQVFVKPSDESLNEESALRCIYGRGLNNLSLDTSAWTNSVHAGNEFALSEEIKIQLPLNLTNRHHIFFVLHAIYEKSAPPKVGQPRSFRVGYAAFPLMVNGVVQARDKIDIKFVSHDQAAVAAAGGYLESFSKAPLSALLNNGDPVLRAAASTKTTVHASNRLIASVFSQCPKSIDEILQDDDVLATAGKLQRSAAQNLDPHRNVIDLISQLPRAEVLAFYPFLSGYAFSLIGASSAKVALSSRMHMLDTLLLITTAVNRYDTSPNTLLRRHGTSDLSAVFGRTTVPSVVYHFLTNDTLFQGKHCGHKTRLYAGMAETWLSLMKALKPPEVAVKPAETPDATPPNGDAADAARASVPPAATPAGKTAPAPPAAAAAAKGKAAAAAPPAPAANAKKAPVPAAAGKAAGAPPVRNLLKEMADLSWFLYDVILRSLYLWGDENPTVPRAELFDESLYTVLGDLCVTALQYLLPLDEKHLVRRTALFVRGLMQFCDRGQALTIYARVTKHLTDTENVAALNTFLKYILEDADAVLLLLPSASETRPVYLTKVLIDSLSLLIANKNREIRTEAATVLYGFLRRLANDPDVSSEYLTCIAAQLFTLLQNIGLQWRQFTQTNDKVSPEEAVQDKRVLAMTSLWILYYTPRSTIRSWLQGETNGKSIAGVMQVITDAQSVFRYTAGAGKAAPPAQGETAIAPEELRDWDARNTTFVTAIGAEMIHIFITDIPRLLRTTKEDNQSPCVYPFFVLLESILNLSNSTVALQISSAVSHEVVCALFPEIISRKARMANGMVLLTFRLMSSCCQYVRSTASHTFLLMSQAFFSWKTSLSKIKSMTANSLVAVAESKTRDLRLAGRFIEFQFDELISRAKIEEDMFNAPSADFNTRYEDDSNAPGGDAQMRYRHVVEELPVSVKRNLPISRYLLEKNADASDKAPPKFSDEFEAMTVTVLSLFDDVLRLSMDDSMKFKESKIFAYFEVFRNFIRQNALKEALKWLYRLYEAHKSNDDLAEAGMVLVFIAALCFRVTEVFYFVKGKSSKGARMPFSILSHVFWQDYVRILPEVDTLLPADTVYAIVSELYVCPDDAPFTIEGQVKALKEAAELLDHGQYYEFSLGAIGIVDTYVRAVKDYRGDAEVHRAMSTWCTAIAEKSKRENNRYFLVWARMEREEPTKSRRELQEELEDQMIGEKPRGLPGRKALRRVYKMPTTTTTEEFQKYAVGYIESLFPDPSVVRVTRELVDTQPALPEPDTKRKRVAATHRQPNHCFVTVDEVQPYFAKGTKVPPDGFDKTMHIIEFENVVQVNSSMAHADGRKVDLMNQRMSISTYELDRAFPSTTSAIDVAVTHQVLLDPFETAEETVNSRREMINQAPENDELIKVLRDALSPGGLPPGAYMKEAISVMNDRPAIIHAVRALNATARKKMEVSEKLNCVAKYPEDYALVLKAITDIECFLIAMEVPDDSADRDSL